jgi:ankyrin repeat protein
MLAVSEYEKKLSEKTSTSFLFSIGSYVTEGLSSLFADVKVKENNNDELDNKKQNPPSLIITESNKTNEESYESFNTIVTNPKPNFLKDVFFNAAFFNAVEEGSIERIKNLFNFKESKDERIEDFLSDDKDSIGAKALISAARNGHAEVVELLINCGAKPSFKQFDYKGNTALMLAAKGGHAEIVELLMDKDARAHLTNIYKEGATALSFAVEKGRAEIVKLLCKYGKDDVNIMSGKYYFEETPLMKAINRYSKAKYFEANVSELDAEGAEELLEELNIDASKDNLNNEVWRKNVSKYLAGNSAEIVSCLIKHNLVELDKYDESGYTALMYAAKKGLAEIVKLLICSGANANLVNFREETALNLAAKKNYADTVDTVNTIITSVIDLSPKINQAHANQESLNSLVNQLNEDTKIQELLYPETFELLLKTLEVGNQDHKKLMESINKKFNQINNNDSEEKNIETGKQSPGSKVKETKAEDLNNLYVKSRW